MLQWAFGVCRVSRATSLIFPTTPSGWVREDLPTSTRKSYLESYVPPSTLKRSDPLSAAIPLNCCNMHGYWEGQGGCQRPCLSRLQHKPTQMSAAVRYELHKMRQHLELGMVCVMLCYLPRPSAACLKGHAPLDCCVLPQIMWWFALQAMRVEPLHYYKTHFSHKIINMVVRWRCRA